MELALLKKKEENDLDRPLTSGRGRTPLQKMKRHWQLYIVMLLPILYIIIFKYVPMYGAQIAFKDFIASKGITGSEWVGFLNFQNFFKSPAFWRLIKNTVGISIYSLAAGFPIPILLALSLNEVGSRHFQKTVQMITYAPYFISTVVMVSMIIQFLSPSIGLIPHILSLMGIETTNILGQPQYLKSIYVWTGVWQYTGYSSVIYIATLSGVNPSLSEASIVDGASKLQRIWHINVPAIMPTAVILLIMNVGQVMNVGFEKVFLLQNPLNMSTSDVIATYVYRIGLIGSQYSFSTAVSLFNSVVNLVLIMTVNQVAKRFGETSLW
jgi:putative aldouronate transport system permease protein